MTSLQIKHGFGKTSSGKLNKKQEEGKFKQIQLGDYDVQMLSPQFLQSKTLKKPLHDYSHLFTKSNSNFLPAENDKTQKNPIATDLRFQPSKSFEDSNTNLNSTHKINYTFIGLNSTNQIKPAYKPVQHDQTTKNYKAQTDLQFSLDDKNTIFSAIMKKGMKPKKSITFADLNQKLGQIKSVELQRKVGKAENKLKQLFNKNVTKPSSFSQVEGKKTEIKKINYSEDIEEEIQQSLNQYGQEGFENYSAQSGIKESIREELGVSSGSGIKQSIREEFANSSYGKNRKSEVMEQIQQSIMASKSANKDLVPEFIVSYKSSKNNIKEEINESLSASKKSGEEVYQEIYEEYQDSFRNSTNAFKKSHSLKEKDSDVLSKSFRKKTNVAKSIKLAEEINHQQKILGNETKNNQSNGNKYVQKLQQEKQHLSKKKIDLGQFLNKKIQHNEVSNKNKNLIFQFKIQLNKLLTSQNFESKLKKLTSFINFGQNDTKNTIHALEDNILKNILTHINNIKKPQITPDQITKLQTQYDEKLSIMLKDQQINLRVEMDRKLHQKDMELKKMIAELEKKFQGKAFASAGAKFNIGMNQQNSQMHNSGLYDAQSDYSIDSDNVSWKADLWQVLPEVEKRKLYEKQTKQVTNFLTGIMMNELKEQSLSRDLDISFQFPDEFNDSNQKVSNLPRVNSSKTIHSAEDIMPKSAFNRKQFDQNISVAASPKKQSIFPDFQRPKQIIAVEVDVSKKQNVNQYSKNQGQLIPETTKKLKMQKQRILQILSKYKSSYIRKKNDVIRKILKTLKPKDMKKVPEQILSVIQQITILSKEDINVNDMVYIRAYEEQLVWALTNIMMKSENKKTQTIEEEMRKNYERLVVMCQAKVAQNAEEVICLGIYQDNQELSKLKNNIKSMEVKPCPLQIPMKEEAVELIQKKEEKNIKNQLVDNIINILMSEFAKEIPKRKR